jgi:hypothetical protein
VSRTHGKRGNSCASEGALRYTRIWAHGL